MIVEEYVKSRVGNKYYAVYDRRGQVTVSVCDISAKDKEDAKAKAAKYLKKTLEEIGV